MMTKDTTTNEINTKVHSGVLAVLVYYFVLIIVYKFYILNEWRYAYFYDEFSLIRLIISVILILAINVFVKLDTTRLSPYILMIFFIASFLPNIVLFTFGQMNISMFVQYIVFWVLMLFYSNLNITTKLKKIPIKYKRFFLKVISIFSVFLVIGFVYRYSNFNFNVDLLKLVGSDIYETRTDVQLNKISRYIYNWSGKVLIPLLSMYYFSKGKKIVTLVYFVLQVMLFLSNPHKMILFIPIVAIALYYIKNINKSKVIWLLSALIIISFILWVKNVDDLSSNMLIRRALFIPARNSQIYYDFFSKNRPYYYASSYLKGFIDDPYNGLGTVKTIATYVFGTSGSPNVGLFGDAYSQLGVLGCMIYPLIYGVIFQTLDAVSSRIDKRLLLGVVVSMSVSLINSAVTTVLRTHGLLFFILLCYFVLPEYSIKAENKNTIVEKDSNIKNISCRGECSG